MRTTFKRFVVGATALAAVAGGIAVSSTPVQAAPPGTPPAGIADLNLPPGGSLPANFTANPSPVPANCQGDSATGGYRWQTFISPVANDPATFTYPGGNATVPGGGVGFTSTLLSSTGNFVGNQNTAVGTGQIVAIPAFNLGAFGAALTPGEYNIGFACSLAGETTRYWSTGVTITATTIAVGVRPAAPVLTTSSYDAATETATVNFTHAASDPATTGYTATLVPIDAAAPIAPISVPAGATSFPIPGVVLGAEYDVTLVATNTVGESLPSAPPLRVRGEVERTVVVDPIADVFEGADVTITWSAPSPAPADYTVAIDGQPAITETGTSTTVSGLAAGDYVVRVTPNYASGSGVTGVASAAVNFTIQLNTLVYQDITVERPPGALVLTQRCGVFGGFPAFDTTGWPGAQLTLDPVTAVAATGAATEAPTVVGGPDDGDPDPLFGSYPQRGTYPTLCGVDLGTSELVTDGPLAGRYYVADGSINQVTVLDTRDGDPGWTAKGDIADLFTNGTGPFDENNSFSGDFLGWFPQVTATSSGQTVTAGPDVSPGTTNGLTSNPTLASAPSGAGLGIATLDARLALIIPVAADADTYTARLSLTVA